jgi:hypothetical protein
VLSSSLSAVSPNEFDVTSGFVFVEALLIVRGNVGLVSSPVQSGDGFMIEECEGDCGFSLLCNFRDRSRKSRSRWWSLESPNHTIAPVFLAMFGISPPSPLLTLSFWRSLFIGIALCSFGSYLPGLQVCPLLCPLRLHSSALLPSAPALVVLPQN